MPCRRGSLLLIFDYETGTLPLEDGIDRLIFFVSHRHQDHFNPAIFYPEGWNGQTEYVLSKDVRKAIRRLEGVPEERCRWMAAGEELRLTSGDGADGREQRERDGQSVRVRTLRSTDCGVAISGFSGGGADLPCGRPELLDLAGGYEAAPESDGGGVSEGNPQAAGRADPAGFLSAGSEAGGKLC